MGVVERESADGTKFYDVEVQIGGKTTTLKRFDDKIGGEVSRAVAEAARLRPQQAAAEEARAALLSLRLASAEAPEGPEGVAVAGRDARAARGRGGRAQPPGHRRRRGGRRAVRVVLGRGLGRRARAARRGCRERDASPLPRRHRQAGGWRGGQGLCGGEERGGVGFASHRRAGAAPDGNQLEERAAGAAGAPHAAHRAGCAARGAAAHQERRVDERDGPDGDAARLGERRARHHAPSVAQLRRRPHQVGREAQDQAGRDAQVRRPERHQQGRPAGGPALLRLGRAASSVSSQPPLCE